MSERDGERERHRGGFPQWTGPCAGHQSDHIPQWHFKMVLFFFLNFIFYGPQICERDAEMCIHAATYSKIQVVITTYSGGSHNGVCGGSGAYVFAKITT